MWLQINGVKVLVHVDDYIPVASRYRFGRQDMWPVYASSKIEGEIWPMIAEKVWAKVTGSYANAESGAVDWALGHLTNDPTESFSVSQLGKERVWNRLQTFSDRGYLMTTGTQSWAWVGNHAFVVMKVMEVALDTTEPNNLERIVKLRNPWATTEWTGAYAEGTDEYTKL